MSGARHRRKGDRAEREVVNLHRDAGVHAERYPASGATRFRNSGHDIDLYIFGTDEPPLVVECKARRSGGGFVWLGDFDVLMLRRNNAFPMVVVPWRVWLRLLEASAPARRKL